MPHFSDHYHLSLAIKANFVNQDSFETSAELILTEYNRLFWNIKSKDRLKDGLKSQTVQSRLEAAVKLTWYIDTGHTASELISETLVEVCKKPDWKREAAKLYANHKTNGSSRNAKQKKKTCNPLGRKFLKTLIIQKWDNYCATKRRGSNKLVDGRNRSISAKACRLSNIDMQNSKETWRQIGQIFNLGKRKTHRVETVSTEQFY